MIVPLVNDVMQCPLTGTTGILTKTNDEAIQITCLLQKQGIPTRLIQTNTDFYLGNLNEIRYFTESLNLCPDTYQIDDERWNTAKRKLKIAFGSSSSWEISRAIVLNFEQVYPRKYQSDWDTYLFESKLEDFYSIQGETIIVSTIHKAKGKEFDNVFLLLNGTEIPSDEKKREIYVAITRAKQNLSIHLNGPYLNDIAEGLAKRQTDPVLYSPPSRLSYLLTHKDLWLDFFTFSNCQALIAPLKSGMPLQMTANGCTDLSGNEILRFSKKFKNALDELNQKGYHTKEARINFVVYWVRQDDKKEVRIVLPEIIAERTLPPPSCVNAG